jgi:hypothetical protein
MTGRSSIDDGHPVSGLAGRAASPRREYVQIVKGFHAPGGYEALRRAMKGVLTCGFSLQRSL